MSKVAVETLDVAFVFWTRWPYVYDRPRTTPEIAALARAVVEACWEFARRALDGGTPRRFAVYKTPGKGVITRADLREECHAWETGAAAAFRALGVQGSDATFVYHPVCDLPVCTAWSTFWQLSDWTATADILAFPAMDSIDVMLSEPFQLTRLDRLPDDVKKTVLEAPERFGELLRTTHQTRGLSIGGFNTVEVQPSTGEPLPGIAMKDRIEDAVRLYTAGTFWELQSLRKLLEPCRDLRVRSEILAVHRECWEALKAGRRLYVEPWEATIQLILGSLLENRQVQQVEFGYLIEETGPKPPTVFVEQLRRAIHTIERLAQFWGQPRPKPWR